jgi:hypothetical protein
MTTRARARAAVVVGVLVASLGVLAPPASAAPLLATGSARSIALNAAEVEASPDGTLVYAVENHDSGVTLYELDAASGTTIRSLELPWSVHPFADSILDISSDGTTAYIKAHPADFAGVYEIDLPSFQERRRAPIGNTLRLLPVPGDASQYVVWGAHGVALIDDGVVQPETVDLAGGLRPNFLPFTSATRFHGISIDINAFPPGSDDALFYDFDLGPDGITLAGSTESVSEASRGAVHEGLLHLNDGKVIDPADQSIEGTYAGVTSANRVLVDAAHGRTWFTTGSSVREHLLADRSLEQVHTTIPGNNLSDATVAGDFLVTTDGDDLSLAATVGIVPIGPGPWVPSVPTALESESVADGLLLSWTAPALDGGDAVDEYQVLADGEPLGTVAGTATSFLHEDAAPLEWHEYRVVAVNSAGSSAASTAIEVVFAPPFSDVRASHPFYDEIRWAAENGIVGGYPDGTFRPGGQVTRQAMAAFLYRLAALPGFVPPAAASFPDVPTDHAFFTEIEWLVALQITTGYDDGRFRPGGTVTRQAMAAYLCRLLSCLDEAPPAGSLPVVFPDVGRSHPFFREITFAYFAELADGYPNGTFRPSGVISRQAATAFLYRFVQLVLSDASSVSGAEGPGWPLEAPQALEGTLPPTGPTG